MRINKQTNKHRVELTSRQCPVITSQLPLTCQTKPTAAMPRQAPLAAQESRRRAQPAQPVQPRRPDLPPSLLDEGLIDDELAQDVARYPGPQHEHRQEEEQQPGQEDQGPADQDEVQIVEPPVEVRTGNNDKPRRTKQFMGPMN